MDYKELIEQLRFFSQSVANEHMISCLYANAATAIETLLAEREAAGWISVENKLPELYTTVIVCHESGVVEALHLAEDGKWNFPLKCGYTTAVTHWMPLPAPPDRERAES